MVSFKSPADTPAKPGMLRKSTAFVPRYQKFESISLQQRVNKLSVSSQYRRLVIEAAWRYRFPMSVEGSVPRSACTADAG